MVHQKISIMPYVDRFLHKSLNVSELDDEIFRYFLLFKRFSGFLTTIKPRGELKSPKENRHFIQELCQAILEFFTSDFPLFLAAWNKLKYRKNIEK